MASVTVSFGESTRRNDEITASWIREQLRARENAGRPVCANLEVECDGTNLRFALGSCGPRGGGRRPHTGCEQAVMDLLNKLGLTGDDITHGKLVAFVNQALRL